MDFRESKEFQNLSKVLLGIKDADGLYAFLEDVCTIREIKDMSQRLLVAQKLDAGDSYTAIADRTGASATTIARVSRALQYGAGGYQQALDILKAEVCPEG